MSTTYSESFKDDVREYYATVAQKAYDKTKSEYKAGRQASSAVYDRFDDTPDKTLRSWCSELRTDGEFDPDKAESFLDGEQPLESNLDNTENPSNDGEEFSYDRVNFDRGDVGNLSNYLVTDHDEYTDYDEENDVYETIIPEYGTIRLPGEIHRAVKTDYSEWVGKGDTISKITRKYPFFDEFIFKKYKKLHGWTHESSPFTKEELQERAIDDMQADLAKLREHELWRNDKEEQLKEYKKAWEELKELKEGKINPIVEKLEDHIPSYDVPNIQIEEADNPYALCVQLRDIHFGAFGTEEKSGDEITLETARQSVMEKVDEIIAKIKHRNAPEVIHLASGDDLAHVDTMKHTTTYGTDIDTVDYPDKIAVEASHLMRDVVDRFRSLGAKVNYHHVQGNHDRLIGRMIAEYLTAWFRNQDDVDVQRTYQTRSYFQYGNSLIGLSHGFDENKTQLHKLMANEASDLWEPEQTRIFFTGHKHSFQVQDGDESGVILIRASSPAGTDSYHKRQGYVGATKAINAYAIDKRGGFPDCINGSIRYG